MQTTERPPTGPVRGSSPMRGVILVAVAAVLGFFVLRAIDDSGGGPTAAEIEAAKSADDSADTPTPAASDTTAPAPRPPAPPPPRGARAYNSTPLMASARHARPCESWWKRVTRP